MYQGPGVQGNIKIRIKLRKSLSKCSATQPQLGDLLCLRTANGPGHEGRAPGISHALDLRQPGAPDSIEKKISFLVQGSKTD